MRKKPHDWILRVKSKEQYLSTIPKFYPLKYKWKWSKGQQTYTKRDKKEFCLIFVRSIYFSAQTITNMSNWESNCVSKCEFCYVLVIKHLVKGTKTVKELKKGFTFSIKDVNTVPEAVPVWPPVRYISDTDQYRCNFLENKAYPTDI